MSYQILFGKLWKDYTSSNPHALKIYELFNQEGEQVINDHIALRTFSDPRVNVEVLATFFKAYGYKECGQYDFPIKKLFAKHYEHPDQNAPKVFISELMLEEFSPTVQQVARVAIDHIPEQVLDSEALLYSGVSWPLVHSIYEELLAESEYAAWMYAFGFCANHFTVNVNALKKFTEIKDVNTFLLQHGFALNTSGGVIKGTPQDCLEQSSTLAGEVSVKFKEGNFLIPSCYYEFAKRYPLANGKLYSGFIAASADKIFESTDQRV